MTTLSVHHVTVADVQPVAFIKAASAAGFSAVSLFANNLGYDLPQVTSETLPEVKAALAGEGLGVTATADFIMTAVPGGGDHARYLDVTAQLGAKYASAVVGELEESASVEAIGRFAEAAQQAGLRVIVEFLRMTPGCQDFVTCDRLVRAAGSDNVGILLDVTHFTRSGGTPELLAGMDTSLVEYVHLADGPASIADEDMADEVVYNRRIVGEGAFPLKQILAHLPAGVLREVEAPTRDLLKAGVSATDRLRRHAAAVRAL